jgi:hypothetical protein
MKKKPSKTEQPCAIHGITHSALSVGFRVDTMGLLTEITNCALPRSMGVLKVPLNVFKNILGEVAERAIELNDPQLNILMLKLALYEMPPKEIPQAIEQQMKLRDSLHCG